MFSKAIKTNMFPRDYNPMNNEYDIAVVVVENKFHYTDYVRPICLPTPDFNPQEGRLIAAGTGYNGDDQSMDMTFITLPACQNDVCQKIYPIYKKGLSNALRRRVN